MDRWMAQVLVVVEGLAIVCITCLIAYRMKLKHERTMLERQTGRDDLELQFEEFKSATQAQIADLHERLDFSERLLAEQRLPSPEESETPTPV